jgi:uncharacterized membrane protein YbhN (UPF0104 family)
LIRRLAHLAFAAMALTLLVGLVSLSTLVRTLAGADLRWLAAALGLYLAGQLVGSLNFHQILHARGAVLSRLDVARADVAGFLYGLSLPGGLAVGGAVRLLHLARNSAASVVLAGLLSSRLLEILCHALIAAATLPLVVGRLGAPGACWVMILGLLVAASAAYAASWHRGMAARFLLLLRRAPLPRLAHRSLRRAMVRLARAPDVSSGKQAAILACAVTRHLLGGLVLLALAQALGAALVPAAAFWVRAVTGIVMLMPITVAGLGVREAAFVVLMAPFGVPAATALAMGLLLFLGTVVLALLGAVSEIEAAVQVSPARRPEVRRSNPSRRRICL